MDIAMQSTTAAQTLFYYFLGIAGICFLIGFHELGHFLMCKLFSVKTPSFSIGFGPRLFSKKIGDTEFSFSAIPLGGYVEIAGAEEVGQGEQKEAQRNDAYSFRNKPYYQKMLILGGGILFNLAFSYAVLVGLLTVGIPKSTLFCSSTATTTIENVRPEGAAHNLLFAGDHITAINGIPVENKPFEVPAVLAKDVERKTVIVNIIRSNEALTIEVPLPAADSGKRRILGVQWTTKNLPAVSLPQAFVQAFSLVSDLIKQTFGIFGSMFKRKSIEGLGGPIRIIQDTMESAKYGWLMYFIALALISINLAVLNMIPLPILDGGQALFYTVEAIIRRPLPSNIRIGIHIACWVLMLALFVYLSISDLWSIITCSR